MGHPTMQENDTAKLTPTHFGHHYRHLYNDYTLFINHRAGDKIILGMTIENHSVVIGNPERLKSIVIHVFL